MTTWIFFFFFIYNYRRNLLCNRYDACMDVTDSDHKPVRCIFSIDIARVDESIKRREYGEIISANVDIRTLYEELRIVAETTVGTENIVLQNQDTAVLQITNNCMKEKAMFEIVCEGQSIKDGLKEGLASEHYCAKAAFGFPRWLEVTSLLVPFCSRLLVPYLNDNNL